MNSIGRSNLNRSSNSQVNNNNNNNKKERNDSSSGNSSNRMYKGELNMKDIQSGYGMGMAAPLATTAAAVSNNNSNTVNTGKV